MRNHCCGRSGWVCRWRFGCDSFSTNQQVDDFGFEDVSGAVTITIPFLLRNKRAFKQKIAVTESAVVARVDLLKRLWNRHCSLPREIISRWLVANESQPQRQWQTQPLVCSGHNEPTSSTTHTWYFPPEMHRTMPKQWLEIQLSSVARCAIHSRTVRDNLS